MSTENPQNVMQSWNLQQSLRTGPVVDDRLAPPDFGKIRTQFISTWREQQLENNLDWGVRNFSIYLPESLRVLSSVFLKIRVPANSGSALFKKYPGIYAVKEFRILSAGQECYTANVKQHLTDYCQSLSQEKLTAFAKTYLGHQDTMDDTERVILVPVLLPNSAYLGRTGSSRGHGIFPAYTGSTRVEIQISMNEAKYLSANVAQQPTSIAGRCSFLYHEQQMSPKNLMHYMDMRGWYSLTNRRFTELTSGWKAIAANVEVSWFMSQPQGTVSEIMLLATINDADDAKYTTAYVKPISLRIEADNIIQKNLDTPEKINMELYSNGFVSPNDDFSQPARLCFAAHASESDHLYSGGYKMTLASNIQFFFKFAAAAYYKIVAVQYQKVKITDAGVLVTSLQ